MRTSINIESKHWVLLDHLPHRHSKRLLLILFLYSLSFALLLVGLRMFCQNLSATSSQSTMQIQNRQDLDLHAAAENAKTGDYPNTQPDTMNAKKAQEIQQDIADHIIRLHVIANSDSVNDQTLKLKVRDEILSQIQTSLQQADTQDAAKHILEQMTPALHGIASAKIQAEGYSYPVRVVIEKRYFPAKTYGDLTFPPGTYQALCVEIGTAQGKNWWCVLFPSLCFVDETTAEVPETSKEALENSLSKESYDSLANGSTPTPAPTKKPEFHSAIYDWIRNSM